MKGMRKFAVLQAACLLMTGGAMMLPAGSRTVLAAEKTVSGEYNGMTYEDYGTRCKINGFTSELPEDLVIPEKIGDMTVEWVGEEAFKGCTKLRSVTIPKTVGYVLEGSFVNCTDLETVTFSERTERVHFYDNPFAGTKWYAAQKAKNPLVIADRTVIDGKSCSGPAAVPEGTEEIVPGAFSGNKALTGITLPETLAVIGREAFSGCSALKEIVIPGGVETVGAKAFQFCTGLTSAEFREGVKVIDQYAFEGCTAMKTVAFPDSLRQINLYAFNKCEKLESVVLPPYLRHVASCAFTECASLKEVTCLYYYTLLSGSKMSADVNTDIGISVSNSGSYSKKFTYSGVFKGYKGSLAEQYADNLGIPFQSIGNPPTSGYCAPEMVWAFEEDTLYIQGHGDMEEFSGYDHGKYTDMPEWTRYGEVAPWFMFRDRIKNVVVGYYVDDTAYGAFSDLPVLERITFQNPKCMMSSNISNGVDENGRSYYNGVVVGFSDSIAHQIAQQRNFRFEALDLPSNAYQRGDVTGDGEISIEDAQTVLKEYTEGVAGRKATFTDAQTTAGDIDGNGAVSVEDAQLILIYYTQKNVAGKDITWDDLLKS